MGRLQDLRERNISYGEDAGPEGKRLVLWEGCKRRAVGRVQDLRERVKEL